MIKEAQAQWLRRAFDLAVNRTKNRDFAMGFASKLFEQTRMNPTSKTPTGVGIANLDPNLEAADPLNPEEAIQFALERDALILEESGDINAAILTSLADTGGQPDAVAVRNIQENIPSIEQALFSDQPVDGEDETFTQIESPERRFRHAVRGDDATATTGVIDELIDGRVAQRNV